MRKIIALMLCCLAGVAGAQDWEDQKTFAGAASEITVRVLSSTDTSVFAPLIQSFVSDNPSISVEYLVTGTADVDRRFRADPAEFDVVISSAMDLQLKLANDGFAAVLDTADHPDWAVWRQSLFGFTIEPAAIVINRAAFDGVAVPQTRQALIEALRTRPDVFQGRVGTYDVRRSGLGYLFATQDARASDTYWRLMEILGGLNVRLYCCSGDMINDLGEGRIAVAYNVLGSYAKARIDDRLQVILPSDFQTTMMRTVLVSDLTEKRAAATAFLQHLLASGAQKDARAPLPLLDPTADATATIGLDPALLTYLDTLKRRNFLKAWEDAVIQ